MSSNARKTTTGAPPRKTNILGAKKTKLGAKKLTPADGALDFEAAERKAREEAERIEKLGYDPEAEKAEEAAISAKGKATAAKELPGIVSPTPVSPPRAGFGATGKTERSSAEMERLGMGVGRLGFGQVGGAKAAPAAKKMGGFGSTGSRAPAGTFAPFIPYQNLERESN
jgi:ADP-ribosylation factor GTPase-activating protein 2/3